MRRFNRRRRYQDTMSGKVEVLARNKKEGRQRLKEDSTSEDDSQESIIIESANSDEMSSPKRKRTRCRRTTSQLKKRIKWEELVNSDEKTSSLEDEDQSIALEVMENDIEKDVSGQTKGKKKKVVKRESQKKKKNENHKLVPRPAVYESLGEGPPRVPSTGKMYVGCHVSGAGGLWNAFSNAEECCAKSFGLFLRNQRQWAAKPLDDQTIKKWKEAIKDMPPHLILPHGSYLMNLGSPVQESLSKSRAMLLEEIGRCERLGIPHYNFHPGSTVGKVTPEECCKTIAESINIVAKQTKDVIFVLENMCCQGNTVGGDFHELRTIIENVEDKTRVGVCLDTCHAHAAGYDLSTESGFKSLIEDFGNIVGWQFLRALHINDSKGTAGSHLDRHENIGKGKIGKAGLSRIMNCKHFQDLPLILETPWDSNEGYAKEIKILESFIK